MEVEIHDLIDAFVYLTPLWMMGIIFVSRRPPRELVALHGYSSSSAPRLARLACAWLIGIVLLIWPLSIPLVLLFRLATRACSRVVRATRRRAVASPVLPVARAARCRHGAR